MTREEGLILLKENLQNQNLIKHCLSVEAIMKSLARHFQNYNPPTTSSHLLRKRAPDYFIYNSGDKPVRKVAKKTKARTIPIKGKYYELNRNAAIAVGKIFKIPQKIILKTIKEFKPLPHRLELVGKYKGITFYNDALSTIPETAILAMETLGKRVQTIFLGGFDRKMSLSWTVYAQSKEELIPMYQKLNYLASSLAPRYNGGFMQGTLAELTVGGYVHDQPGIITGLNYELSEQSTWDIGINDAGGSDDRVKELPHMIKVTGFSFTPIHTFIPERQRNAYSGSNGKVSSFGQERYIALAAETNNYDT